MGRIVPQDILRLAQQDLPDSTYSFERVLDFGCGCGRVLRHVRDEPMFQTLYGADIDAELITWCSGNIHDVSFTRNEPHPPTAFPDSFFQFIYSISVFTHLDEPMQFEWLAELRRIAAPGGLLLLSVHGPSASGQLSPGEREQLTDQGFLFVSGPTGKFKPDGLPDFYQTTFHTRAYVESEWTRYFRLIRFVDRGINQHQDAVLLAAVKM